MKRVVVVRFLVVRTQNFLSPAYLGSGKKRKIFEFQPRVLVVRVVVVRTQNFRSPAARGNLHRGRGTNAKLS